MPMIVNVAGAGAGKTTKMADVRAELRHLCLDLVAFLRRHIEHQWNGAAALFHRASRSLFEDADRSAARAGVPCSFSRTETFCWLRCCSAAKSLRT